MKIHPSDTNLQITGPLSPRGLLALNEGAVSAGEMVAIGVARSKGINDDLARAIVRRMVTVLTNETSWVIVNLTQLREAEMVHVICAPKECLEIGFNAGARKALIVNISRVGGSYTLGIALTDISNIDLPVEVKSVDGKYKCSRRCEDEEDNLIDEVDLLTKDLLARISVTKKVPKKAEDAGETEPAEEEETAKAEEEEPAGPSLSLDSFLDAEKTSFSLQFGLGYGQLANSGSAERPTSYDTTVLLVNQRSPLSAGSLKLGFDPIVFSNSELSFGVGSTFAVNHNLSDPDYEVVPNLDMALIFSLTNWDFILRATGEFIKIERPSATLSMPAGDGLHAQIDLGASWEEDEDYISSAALGYGVAAFFYDELLDPSHDSPFMEHGVYLTLSGKWKPGEDSAPAETAPVLAGDMVIGARGYEFPDSPFDAEGGTEASGMGLVLGFNGSATWHGFGLYPSLQWREPMFGSLKGTLSGLLGAAWDIDNDWRMEGSLMAGEGTFESYDLDRYGAEVALVLRDLHAGEFVIEPGVNGTYMLLADHIRRTGDDAPSLYNFVGVNFFLRFRFDTGEGGAETSPPKPYFLERGIAAWGRGR